MHYKISRFNKAHYEYVQYDFWHALINTITEMNDHMKQRSNKHYCVYLVNYNEFQ